MGMRVLEDLIQFLSSIPRTLYIQESVVFRRQDNLLEVEQSLLRRVD